MKVKYHGHNSSIHCPWQLYSVILSHYMSVSSYNINRDLVWVNSENNDFLLITICHMLARFWTWTVAKRSRTVKYSQPILTQYLCLHENIGNIRVNISVFHYWRGLTVVWNTGVFSIT